jgi:hypothetical protein
MVLGGPRTQMEGRACRREGLVPSEAKHIPKGLVKVNKSNVIGLMCVHRRRCSNGNINSNFNSRYLLYKIIIIPFNIINKGFFIII